MANGNGRKRRPTLLDVARKANVSRATASLVLRKSPLVGAETRQAVEAAMAELGYVYNLGAARMRAARSRTVGVIIPNLPNPFFGVLLAGVDEVMDAAGMATFIAHSAESPAKQDAFMTRMREHAVDGVIVSPAAGTTAQFIERAAEWSLPLVQALRFVKATESDYVGMDQMHGMDQAIARLAALGHRKIGFVTDNLHHSAHEDRLQAFRTALARHGLRPAEEIEIEPNHAVAAELARSLAGRTAWPTAWVCHNDVIGLGMHRGFSDLGYMPGRDVSLIGFDNVAEADLVRPGLASVATEPSALGVAAAKLLLQRIESPEAPFRTQMIPTRFVDRGSVGPVPERARVA